MLRGLEPGWCGDGSEPLDPKAEKHFRSFVAQIPEFRYTDIWPTMWDDGSIILEWTVGARDYTANIVADALFLCTLAPDEADDESVELDHYDEARLLAYFLRGEIHP